MNPYFRIAIVLGALVVLAVIAGVLFGEVGIFLLTGPAIVVAIPISLLLGFFLLLTLAIEDTIRKTNHTVTNSAKQGIMRTVSFVLIAIGLGHAVLIYVIENGWGRDGWSYFGFLGPLPHQLTAVEFGGFVAGAFFYIVSFFI